MTREHKKALERFKQKLALIGASTSINPYETKAEIEERIERAKSDPKFMVEHYFPHYAGNECADFHIEFAHMVKRNRAFKGYAEWGRGLAKSVWVDVFLPFWLWMNDEAHYFVLIGRNETRAKELLSDLQAEFQSNSRIIQDFGKQELLGSWEDGNFKTANGFRGKALGMGQSVRGLRDKNQRPDLCVWDDLEEKDLVKNPKRQDEMADWIEGALLPTMDGEIRRGIGANNAFAPRMIQTVLKERHPKWKFHRVCAYDPATYKPAWKSKYDADYYKRMEEEIGVLIARAEFNHDPHIEGKIFKDDYWNWGKSPARNHFKVIVGHWDVAYAGTPTSDFNAVKVWGLHGRRFWNIDNFVKQCKMRMAIEWMADVQLSLPKSVKIQWRFESQFWNDEVERTIREVEADFGISLRLYKVDTPRTRKYDRILSLAAYYQNGRIWVDEKLKGHNDTKIGIAQTKGIEPGYSGNDDAPDADEQAISYLSEFIPHGGGNHKPIIGTHKRKYNLP